MNGYFTKRPLEFPLGGSRVLGHRIAGVVAEVKTGEVDDITLALKAGEHAFGRAVSYQGERKVNGAVGLSRKGWCVAIRLVVDQFNGGWRARDDLPCEPDQYIEGIRVGDRAGDANVRGIAVPFIGCRFAINGGGEGYIGERRFLGLVRFVGIIGGIVDHWSGLQGVRSGETWNVEGGGLIV